MDKLVSVILPVYGVEAYLPECVESLLRQSYENLEIILVDDASPDRCGVICDEFAIKDNRVRVIHKTNGGAAGARNAGLDAARGALVCFVDSDDLVEPDYVQTLLETLGDADMAMCGFFLRSRNGSQTESPDSGCYDREGFLRKFLSDWRCSLLWNKIFRREAIGDIRMEEGHRVDDEFFTYRVVLNSNRVTVTDKCLYHYRLRASSVMQNDATARERMMLDRISYVTARCETVSEAVPTLAREYFADAADTLCRYWIHSKDMPKAQAEIQKWARRNVLNMLAMGRRGIGLLWNFRFKKPQVCGEPRSLAYPEEMLYP